MSNGFKIAKDQNGGHCQIGRRIVFRGQCRFEQKRPWKNPGRQSNQGKNLSYCSVSIFLKATLIIESSRLMKC